MKLLVELMNELNEIYDAISVSILKIQNMQELLSAMEEDEQTGDNLNQIQNSITAEQEVLSNLEAQRDALE
jgi:hypothetical protein